MADSDCFRLSVHTYSWACDPYGPPPEDSFKPALAHGMPIAAAESGVPSRGCTSFFIAYDFELDHQTDHIEFMLR